MTSNLHLEQTFQTQESISVVVNSEDNSTKDDQWNSYWLGGSDSDLSSSSNKSDNNNADDNDTVFSYPSDVSHYSITGHLTPKQLEEKKERKNLKAQRRSHNLPPVKTKEKIMVGDILIYVPAMYVQGSSFHAKNATVISINPKSKHKIELDNGDKLEDSHMVRRIKILNKGKLISHPG